MAEGLGDDLHRRGLHQQRQAEKSDQPEDLATPAVTTPVMLQILEDTPPSTAALVRSGSLGRDYDAGKTASA